MTDLQLSRRTLILGALALLLALTLASRLLRHAGTAYETASPAGQAASGVIASPASFVVVHVVGAVHRPGLYRLPQGSRIFDAVRRAGGATPKAALALVNLAAPLADGTQIVVPARAPPAGGAGRSTPDLPTAPARPGHLNTATLPAPDAPP